MRRGRGRARPRRRRVLLGGRDRRSPRVAPERAPSPTRSASRAANTASTATIALRRSRDGRSGAGAPAARDRHEPRRHDRRRRAGGRTRGGRRARSSAGVTVQRRRRGLPGLARPGLGVGGGRRRRLPGPLHLPRELPRRPHAGACRCSTASPRRHRHMARLFRAGKPRGRRSSIGRHATWTLGRRAARRRAPAASPGRC